MSDESTLVYPKKDKQVNKFVARQTMRKLWLLCLFPPLIPIVLAVQLFYSITLVKRCVGLFILAILSIVFGTCAVVFNFQGEYLRSLDTSYSNETNIVLGADFYKQTQEIFPELQEKKAFVDQEYVYINEIMQEINNASKWNEQIARQCYDELEAHLSELVQNGVIQRDGEGFYVFSYLYCKDLREWPHMTEHFEGYDRGERIEKDGTIKFLKVEYYLKDSNILFENTLTSNGHDMYGNLSELRNNLEFTIENLGKTVEALELYLREEPAAFPNGEIPDVDTAMAAFRSAWETYLKTNEAYMKSTTMMAVFGGIGGGCYFLLTVGCILFACRGKELRKKVKAVAKEMDVLGGKPKVEQYMNALTAASRKKDAEAFYTEMKTRHEQCLAAVPTLPFATQQDMRTGINEIVVRCAVTESASRAKTLRKECKVLWKNRDHAKLLEYKQLYAEKFEEYRLKVLENTKTEEFTPEYEGQSRFDGNVLQKFGWDVLCFVVKWITLTIAKPATECWKQRWYTKHTVIDGKRLSFDGSGAQLFGKRSLNLFLTIITFGIYAIFSDFSMEKWAAKHTHVKGEYQQLGGTFDGNLAVWFFIRLGCFLLNVCTLFLLKPFTYCWKRGWYIRHCVYDGRRMVFDGKGAQLFGTYIKWFLLSIVTLGVYYLLWMSLNMKRWETKHTHLEEGYSCTF